LPNYQRIVGGGIDRESLTAAAFMLLDTSSKPSSLWCKSDI
jgi:hypothetical protein